MSVQVTHATSKYASLHDKIIVTIVLNKDHLFVVISIAKVTIADIATAYVRNLLTNGA